MLRQTLRPANSHMVLHRLLLAEPHIGKQQTATACDREPLQPTAILPMVHVHLGSDAEDVMKAQFLAGEGQLRASKTTVCHHNHFAPTTAPATAAPATGVLPDSSGSWAACPLGNFPTATARPGHAPLWPESACGMTAPSSVLTTSGCFFQHRRWRKSQRSGPLHTDGVV
jgi:hypothetical protein